MEQHLRTLEHELKRIRDVKIDLVEARDHKAPSLFAIEIGKSGERAEKAVETVAQVLRDFLHTDTAALSHKTIYLVTIEGARIETLRPMLVKRARDECGLELNVGPSGIDSRPALIAEKYAEVQGKGATFHAALMQAYWQQARSIDDRVVLKEIAEQVDLNTE